MEHQAYSVPSGGGYPLTSIETPSGGPRIRGGVDGSLFNPISDGVPAFTTASDAGDTHRRIALGGRLEGEVEVR